MTGLSLILLLVLSQPLPAQLDFHQAELMLDLLESAARGVAPPEKVEALLGSPGTDLIIGQQNISRAVTRDQYRTLLQNLTKDEFPDIRPADSGERARRGAEGLRNDVWPELKWAMKNTALLRERIARLKRSSLLASARALSARFLPGPVTVSPKAYVVMGGRAGAAALDGGSIYFDVLATSFRATTGALNRYPTIQEQVEYFAHEIHHLGLSEIIKRMRDRLRLGEAESLAFDFISALVMEGSASYLINGHRSLRRMRSDAQFAENLSRGEELLASCEMILRSVLEKGMRGEEYEKAIAPLQGTGWHSAGAIMFQAIDKAGGLRSINRVLRDPGQLLRVYNDVAAKTSPKGGRPRLFDAELVRRVSAFYAL